MNYSFRVTVTHWPLPALKQLRQHPWKFWLNAAGEYAKCRVRYLGRPCGSKICNFAIFASKIYKCPTYLLGGFGLRLCNNHRTAPGYSKVILHTKQSPEMDPFEVRMQFLTLLRRLNALVQSLFMYQILVWTTHRPALNNPSKKWLDMHWNTFRDAGRTYGTASWRNARRWAQIS